MIQDIIQYVDEENEEGVIVFLDQQQAFDRVEWGWIDFVLDPFWSGCISLFNTFFNRAAKSFEIIL
jgi:hypothetical protein